MNILSPTDYQTFEQLVKMKQKTLKKTMTEFLNKRYDKVVTTSKYIIATGTIPVAIVAHLDTVFSLTPHDVYYDRQKNVMWSPEGLGADDRAGVFAIIKLVQKGYRPHIIFTTDEEIGGIGALALSQDFTDAFADMKYIIQLDRQGANDCVFYDCANPSFTNYVSSFGFVEDYGSFSDISVLCPAWGIAGVNLSIGYKDEHSYIETLNFNYFYDTLNKVIKMLKDIGNSEYYRYIPNPYKYRFVKNWKIQDLYNGLEAIQCPSCKESFSEVDLYPVKLEGGRTQLFCYDCVDKVASWCAICGEPFEDIEHQYYICPDCERYIVDVEV